MSASKLLKALRAKNLHEAHEIFGSIMQTKVRKRLAEEKKDVMAEAEQHKCEQCGSTKDVREVGDGYVCKECDVED